MTDQGPLFPTAQKAPSAARRALRWVRRKVLRPLLWILLVLVVVHLTATVITGIMLNRQLARLKARGESLRVIDMVEKLPPGTPNAAPIYQQAFDSLRLSEAEKQVEDLANPYAESPPPIAMARRVVAANADYYRLLEQASRMERAVFPVKWEDPLAAVFPHLAKMRQAARLLVVRSKLRLLDGQTDAAAEDCATLLRMAEHAESEPTVINALVSYALHKIGLQQLEEVLSTSDPSPAMCRELAQQPSIADNRARMARALRTERAVGRALFHDASRRPAAVATSVNPDFPGDLILILHLYSTLGRPLMNLDELTFHRTMDLTIAAATLPYPQSAQQMKAASDAIERLPSYRNLLSHMLMPIYTHFPESTESVTAVIGAARLALDLKLYRYQHGAYPPSLDALPKAGKKLPLDPFTQKPYHYRTEGSGFVVWSVGPDLVDNRGAEPQGGRRWSVPRPEGDEPPSDLAFRVKQ